MADFPPLQEEADAGLDRLLGRFEYTLVCVVYLGRTRAPLGDAPAARGHERHRHINFYRAVFAGGKQGEKEACICHID